MEDYYIRIDWPEYQDYLEFDEFIDCAEYCPDSDCYFVNVEWINNLKYGNE